MKNRKSVFTMTFALNHIEFKTEILLVLFEDICIQFKVFIVEYAEDHFFD